MDNLSSEVRLNVDLDVTLTVIEWVREWACAHPLPVVAMGSIPHIYRRAPFGHRATP